MADFLNLLKSFQSIVTSYQDIATIYNKLEVQGQLDRLTSVLIEIFNEEHEFTLNVSSELKRYGKENNQPEEEFLEDQYELNATIFRRNFTLIVQSLAEEIGKGFLDKFKREFRNDSKRYSGQIRMDQDFIEEQKLGIQKHQYKSDMPEIQEEVESNGRVSPVKSSAQSNRRSELEVIPNTRSFELNIDDLSQRYKVNQSEDSSREIQHDEALNNHALPPSNTSSNSLTNVTMVPPSGAAGIKKKEKADGSRTLSAEHLIGISNELNQLKDSFRSVDNTRETVPERGSTQMGVYLRSPSYERMSLGSNYKKTNTSRGLSPSNKVTKSTTTSLSSSRISAPANMPDLNMLDSEFSYTKGNTFAKSERTGLFPHPNVPGPGHYETDDILKAVKKKAPVASFPRSPKFSVFEKAMNDSPGAIYNPSLHFVSK